MARITLSELRHSYMAKPREESDWALKQLDLEWDDGGAYALLGPSGCGKTTLLNIISGLLAPSHGAILFDDEDVTGLPPEQRHIAQVFQFPVVYDTMTVYDNLAFPLRNRGVPESEVDKRVTEIAAMTDLSAMLKKRAPGLTADGKQKISLGRGLVRTDVNAILFDEPLTVIDPHLKFQLRSKLKELHQRVSRTMIYVTHDQTEALTFADKVVVMNVGEVVQIGTPEELFEEPQHTFVGHFIGSPGMNVLPCEIDQGQAVFAGRKLETSNKTTTPAATNEIGVRPEHVRFAEQGLEARVVKVSDAGRFNIVEAECGGHTLKLLVKEGAEIPSESARIEFISTENQKAWFLVLPVLLLVAFNAIVPLMTVVNYSVQETFGDNVFFWAGISWFDSPALRPAFTPRLGGNSCSPSSSCHRGAAGRHHRAGHAAQRHLGVGLPGADGAAAADPVERRRRDVEHLRAAGDRPARATLNMPWVSTTTYTQPDRRRLVHPDLMDVWHWTSLVVLLAYAGLVSIPDAYYQAAQDRRRIVLGGLPLHPVAEDETGADHRDPAALHGQLQHLHRALRADRRRPGQLDHACCRSTWSRSRWASSTWGRRRRCR
jgi:glycerol transport system ATP-binding protein